MSSIFNPTNSVWPNGLKVDSENYTTFYTLGTNKVDISTVEWPVGDKLVTPFVYQNEKLVGFCDTQAMTVSGNATISLPYTHIEADFSSIKEGDLEVNAPNATVKEFKWSVVPAVDGSFDYVIVDFTTTDQETIDAVRTAYKVVNKKMYDVDGNVIGTWDTSKLEVGGIFDKENWMLDGVFCNYDFTTYRERDLILTEFDSDLSSLTNGGCMFNYCSNLTTFTSDMNSLTNGEYMFSYCSNLTTVTADLSSLTNGEYMFYECSNLTTFTSDLSSLTNGEGMFDSCSKLTTFTSNLSSLTNGGGMFYKCSKLVTFSSDLGSLTNGNAMFNNCKLDTPSVQHIAQTINRVTNSPNLHIDIGNKTPNSEETESFNTMVSKGWKIYVNGSEYTSASPASIMTLDENGEDITTPIPYWAKPVQSDEYHATYTDNEGNFFNILGAQFIYGDDLSTYGMFTCEEDAAANMRLTKIERN